MSNGLAAPEAVAVELWNDDRNDDAMPVLGYGGEGGPDRDGLLAECGTSHGLLFEFESGALVELASSFDRTLWPFEG